VKATVLPVPVLDPPMQSLPFKISGIHAFWIPVGFLISIDAKEAESHGATPIEAKLLIASVLAEGSEVEGKPDVLDTESFVVLALIRDAVGTGAASFLLFLEPAWCSEISSSERLGEA